MIIIAESTYFVIDGFDETSNERENLPAGFEKLSTTEKELYGLPPEMLMKYRILRMFGAEI